MMAGWRTRYHLMDNNIVLSEDSKYIVVVVKEVTTAERILEYIFNASDLGMRVNVHHYLIDLTRSHNDESVARIFFMVNKDMLKNLRVDRTARVAFLVCQDDHSRDFLETVLRNAGFAVRLFYTLEAAVHFLVDSNAETRQCSIGGVMNVYSYHYEYTWEQLYYAVSALACSELSLKERLSNAISSRIYRLFAEDIRAKLPQEIAERITRLEVQLTKEETYQKTIEKMEDEEIQNIIKELVRLFSITARGFTVN